MIETPTGGEGITGVIRPWGRGDSRTLLALKAAAGWNQVEADLDDFRELAPDGCFLLETCDGLPVASATAVPYGVSVGWIGMVLVDPGHRRRGYGTRVFEHATRSLNDRGIAAALDATPAGASLYSKHGFEEVDRLERRVGIASQSAPERESYAGGFQVARSCDFAPGLRARMLERLESLDREAFGADRGALLARRRERHPELEWVARGPDGELRGFLLGRPGSEFLHLGPCVAGMPELAVALIETAIASCPGVRVGIDVPARDYLVREHVESRGLKVERGFTRMVQTARASESFPGSISPLVHAIVGPEWG